MHSDHLSLCLLGVAGDLQTSGQRGARYRLVRIVCAGLQVDRPLPSAMPMVHQRTSDASTPACEARQQSPPDRDRPAWWDQVAQGSERRLRAADAEVRAKHQLALAIALRDFR